MIEAGRSFRIVVLSELLPRPEYSATPEPLLAPIAVDRNSFDDVMHALGVTLCLEVADPFLVSQKLALAPLRLSELKAFRPAALADHVPELRALRAVYQVLLDFEQRRRTFPDALEQLERALAGRGWSTHISGLFSSSPERTAGEPERTAGEPENAAPTPAHGSPTRTAPSGLDSLLDLVALPEERVPPATHGKARSAIEDLISSVVVGAAKPEGNRSDSARARAAVEAAFSRLLCSLLQHLELVRLERAWRGLRLLVEHSDPRSGAEIQVVPVRPSSALAALEKLNARDDSERGRAAVDLVVVDYHADGNARDRALLSSWAQQAERLRAPVLVGAGPGLLGFPSLEELAKTGKVLSSSDEAWAVALRALRGRPESRWLMLALNDLLVRASHTAESSRLSQPQFTEWAGTPAVFAAAPFAGAILALKSFATHGHPFQLRAEHGGPAVIENLMVHEVGESSHRTAIAVEAPIDAELQTELARLGIVALAAVRNRDRAVLTQLPMLWRADAGSGAELTLTDQLFVGRMSRAINALGDAIPDGADTRAIQEVAQITLAELFLNSSPPGPEVAVDVAAAPPRLVVTLRPHRYCGVTIEEIVFEAKLLGAR